ncbi:unnamed protein product [Chondrus crispus]|uniref:CCT domain-containing protein n=1 Tax=Chondrus crispus TaxID=2769 RepID=R7Q4Q6_CHOCR|nr:unnamed protein product [Chondrus crispus]CDF32361.1 unnamed protein product [Chondrus crispus]|eukprot:XP_005712026.1 unnamed protein product [Chondrus crispus]
MEKMSAACAEMNALFCNSMNPNDSGYRSDGNQQPGIISMMSSPELRNETGDASGSGGSGFSSSGSSQRRDGQKSSSGSQSSSQTPPPAETSSCTPTNSLPDESAKNEGEVAKSEALFEGSEKFKKTPSAGEKQKRPSTRTAGKPSYVSESVSGSVSGSVSAPISAASVPPPASHVQMQMKASAMMAANAAAMNPGMAGLLPFACAMPSPMGHMLPPPGAMHYQGRPVAFVTGANGTEIIPMDMFAQATALQYGAAAQAAMSRMMHPVAGQGPVPPRPAPHFEAIGGSRKRRRRQLLERSGCTEEQARQNRAHALTRLRQKKTLRSQQSKVRYACRKRIAMVRPRVNGRFATKEEVEECKRSNS